MWSIIEEEALDYDTKIRKEIIGDYVTDCISEARINKKVPEPPSKEKLNAFADEEKIIQYKYYIGWVVEILVLYIMSYFIVFLFIKQREKI